MELNMVGVIVVWVCVLGALFRGLLSAKKQKPKRHQLSFFILTLNPLLK